MPAAVSAIRELIEREVPQGIMNGTIVSVQYPLVRLRTSEGRFQDAVSIKGLEGLVPGDCVLVARIPGATRLIVFAAFSDNQLAGQPHAQMPGEIDIAPPANVSVHSASTVLYVTWDATPVIVTFEVQHNSSASSSGASVVSVMGSEYTYYTDGETRYFRVRSVLPVSGQRSGWSTWVSGTAVPESSFLEWWGVYV